MADDAKKLEADENAIIEMVERNGEAWLAEMLSLSLQHRADNFDGPKWRRERLLKRVREVESLRADILKEDADCLLENRGTTQYR
jgi:hypothetical protein